MKTPLYNAILQTDQDFAGFQPLNANLSAYAGANMSWNTTTHQLDSTAGVVSAALTKTDDTNVTLTLGGTPTAALLAATSLTLGWTGTLAITRGGTGAGTSTAARTALGAEATLGNPATDGYVLSSTAAGVRSWISPSSGGTVSSIATTSPITGGTITTSGTLGFNNTVDLAMIAAQSVTLSDATNNSPSTVLSLAHNTSGTPAAGLGAAMVFAAQTTGTGAANSRSQAVLASTWTDANNATRTGTLDIQLALSGIVTPRARFFGSGGFTVGNTTDPGAAIISANTGYWVGTTASTSGKILKSDGAAFKASTELYAAPGTVNNIMVSDGTNWTSSPVPAIAPINSQSGSYTFLLSDAGQAIIHASASAGHTFTIPANAVVSYPVGTQIIIINADASASLSLACSDTLRRGDGTAGTGTRTIGADSVCTIIKTASTEWYVTGRFS